MILNGNIVSNLNFYYYEEITYDSFISHYLFIYHE